MNKPYSSYDVLEKWDSPSFDDITRAVLDRRLHSVPERRFFTPEEWELLEVLSSHLIAQSDVESFVPIVPWIDEKLANGAGEGFRRTDEPSPSELWRTGLASIDREARRRRGLRFAEMDQSHREMLLGEIRAGTVSDAWIGTAPKRFLIDVVLKTMVAIFYSHPEAWSQIGFGGPASPRGYVRLGLDRHDPWEAEETR